MAIQLRNLTRLAYANGFTLWHYRTGTDPLKEILQDIAPFSYFQPAAEMLADGDMVLVKSKAGAALVAIDKCKDGFVAPKRVCE